MCNKIGKPRCTDCRFVFVNSINTCISSMLTQVIDNLLVNALQNCFYSVRYVGSLFWTSGCVLVHKGVRVFSLVGNSVYVPG